jgi:hypothetical protein
LVRANDELLMLMVGDRLSTTCSPPARLVMGLAQLMWDAGLHYDGALAVTWATKRHPFTGYVTLSNSTIGPC